MEANELRALARRGATARLQELEQERQAIFRVFPDLRKSSGGKSSTAVAAAPAEKPGRRRKRRKMSAAERKEVSERMSRYWAARRAGNAPAKKQGTGARRRRSA